MTSFIRSRFIARFYNFQGYFRTIEHIFEATKNKPNDFVVNLKLISWQLT